MTSYTRATAPFVWASKLATCKKKQYWNGRASRICSKSCHAKRTESREIITTQWTRKSIEAIPHSMRMIESSAHTMVQKCQSGLRRWTNGLPTIIAGMHVDCESKESRGLHDVICMALESLKGFEAHWRLQILGLLGLAFLTNLSNMTQVHERFLLSRFFRYRNIAWMVKTQNEPGMNSLRTRNPWSLNGFCIHILCIWGAS